MARKTKKLVKNEKKIAKLIFSAVSYVIGWIILMVVAAVVSFSKIKAINDAESVLQIPIMDISLSDVTLTEVHENGKEIKYPGNTVELSG